MIQFIKTTILLVIILLPVAAQGVTSSGIHPNSRNLSTRVYNKPMVLKSNTLSNQLLAPMAKSKSNALSVQDFFSKHGVTPADNKLTKKAPSRMSSSEVTNGKMIFSMAYDFNIETNEVTLSNSYQKGGYTLNVTEVSPGVLSLYVEYDTFVYDDDLFYSLIDPVTIHVDYVAKTAEMFMDTIGCHQWCDSVEKNGTIFYYDTTQYVIIANEDYLKNYPNDNLTNITGTIDDDGSMYFADGFCFIYTLVCTQRKSTSDVVTQNSNSIIYLTPFYRDTYLLKPNGTHTYYMDLSAVNEYGEYIVIEHNYPGSNDVYMFQADDTTAVVWNLWGGSNRGTIMNIYEDSTMVFPTMQVLNTWDPSAYQQQYPELHIDNEMVNLSVEYNAEGDFVDVSTASFDNTLGKVTPTEITWDATLVAALYYDAEGDSDIFVYIDPRHHNKLTFTDGSRWFVTQGDDDDDGLYYRYQDNGNAIVIAGEIPYSGDIIIPETTRHDGRTYTVTAIDSLAFANCTELTSVTTPNTMTSIGYQAFDGCTALTSISIGNSVNSIGHKAFNKCEGLTRVDITDLEAWCRITFENKNYTISQTTTPCYYAHHLFLNGVEIKNLVIPSSISSINQMAFCGCSELTNVTIPNSVTSIGRYAFSNCSGLSSVTISNSVTTIGSLAFYKCTGLSSITIPNSVTTIDYEAFEACSGLTSIAIPNSVTSIGRYAFSGCTGLKSVSISNSVTSIDVGAFNNCNSLNKVEISSIDSWCQISFKTTMDYHGNFILSSNPLYLAHHLFLNGTEITDLVIPGTVSSIYDYAFAGCEGLNNLSISNSVTSIGKGAFGECINLKNAILPDSITNIQVDTFFGCSKLTTINIPSSVSSIDANALAGCDNLSHIYITDLEAWCNIEYSFDWNWPIPTNPYNHPHHLYLNGEEIKDLVIPNSITSINICNFQYCSWLTSIYIPNSITSIDAGAFEGCNGLTAIIVDSANTAYDSRNNCNAVIESSSNTLIYGCMNTVIPNSVTAIGRKAFYRFNGLTSIRIPSSITSIGNYAFAYCSGLNDVYSDVADPASITIGYDVFYRSPSNYGVRTLHVPVGSLEAYQADANWYPYFGSIVEMELAQGDANGDGTIDVTDVTSIINVLLNNEVDSFNREAADLNSDGALDIDDVIALINKILGLS